MIREIAPKVLSQIMEWGDPCAVQVSFWVQADREYRDLTRLDLKVEVKPIQMMDTVMARPMPRDLSRPPEDRVWRKSAQPFYQPLLDWWNETMAEVRTKTCVVKPSLGSPLAADVCVQLRWSDETTWKDHGWCHPDGVESEIARLLADFALMKRIYKLQYDINLRVKP